MKALKVITTLLVVSTMTIGFTGCKEDSEDKSKELKSYYTLALSDVAMHRDRGSIKVTEVDSPNQVVEEDKSDNVGAKYDPNAVVEQEGSPMYKTKFGYSQLLLENDDTTEYFEVSGEDIVYGGITYLGLNKALDSIEYPYDKRTLINFIVKTYDPMDTQVQVNCIIADDEGYVEGWSMGMHDSLADSWPDYLNLVEQYNKIVKWEITLADKETYDRQSYLYGCSDYMIYLSYTSGETIDMSNFEEIKP